MNRVKIVLVGAGSRSFGPSTVRDVLLSEVLAEREVELALMDINPDTVEEVRRYAKSVAEKLGRGKVCISADTDLDRALEGADFVVDAVEVSRDTYWAMDYHIPRRYGFKQIYGENGGPGSHFHALRTMKLIVEIARAMERQCPGALLLNYTNPMHKLCQAATQLTKTPTVGLCHGIYMGRGQLAFMLDRPLEKLKTTACGINHFTWFQTIQDADTGEDLYPELREREATADWMSDWHEIGLSRILFRRFGLYPSPGTNHIGEYIGWADEFYANEFLWFYDPMDGHPWGKGDTPEFLYSMGHFDNKRAFKPRRSPSMELSADDIRFSGEAAVPIIEALSCDRKQELAAVNVPNDGYIAELPCDLIVEVPASGDGTGLKPRTMGPLPEPVAAMIRVQASIQKLLVEAFDQGSKEKLLQALLLEPTVNSYRGAAAMMEEMLELQRDLLPELH